MNKPNVKKIGLIFILCSILVNISLIPFLTLSSDNYIRENIPIKNSATELKHISLLKNNDFSSSDHWYKEQGILGDNKSLYANISNGTGNYIINGDEYIFDNLSGTPNTTVNSNNWKILRNGEYLLPDVVEMNESGCYIYHNLDESENGSIGQVHNFPSVHFKKNISLKRDMSLYEIDSVDLNVIINATVNSNVDTPRDNETLDQYAIFDSATFYVEITDLENQNSFRIAEFKTKYLGQDSPSNLILNNTQLDVINQSDVITALNLALEKDPFHANFTFVLGLDIYCEDNIISGGGDQDEWSSLIINTCNFSFTYKKKVTQFSSIAWNQVSNQLNGTNTEIVNATFNFEYKIDNLWPTSLSPFSEIRILINDNRLAETIRLNSANQSFQEGKLEGFDVKNLISEDENVSISIQLFIANTFGLNQNITLSIDRVYLNITYQLTIPDFESQVELWLNRQNKSSNPFIEIPTGELLNITVVHSDNNEFINNSNIILEGEGIRQNLIQDPNSLFYSLIINSSEQLNIGTSQFTITIEKENYQTININPSIRVRKVKVKMESPIDRVISINPGEDVALKVLLNNTDFGGNLSGIDLTYSGSLGNGLFTDENLDGLYEARLTNIPEGSYTITVNAFESSKFEFENIDFTINSQATTGLDLSWLVYILIGGIAILGGFIVIYQKILKYPLVVRKIRKLRNRIKNNKDAKPVDVDTRENIISKYSTTEKISIKTEEVIEK